MKNQIIKNGVYCEVIAGTHKGKSGVVSDIHTSKTGHVTLTVTQDNGVRFKTLAKSVTMKTPNGKTKSFEDLVKEAKLSAPAQRALKSAGIISVEALRKWSDEALLELHGVGPTAIPKLRGIK
jgi:ribosomal protein L24